MPHLNINFHPEPSEITLDDLIGRIIAQISGANITVDNWYTNRRAEEERVLQRLKEAGHSVQFGDEILSSIDRAAVRRGPTKGIAIPRVDKGVLNGRISRELMLMYSDTPIDEATVDRLLKILRPLGIVKDVEVSDMQPPWKAQSRIRGHH